jgi:hypothetical protein
MDAGCDEYITKPMDLLDLAGSRKSLDKQRPLILPVAQNLFNQEETL